MVVSPSTGYIYCFAYHGRVLGLGESNMLKTFLYDDTGISALEYALIAALVTVMIVAGLYLRDYPQMTGGH